MALQPAFIWGAGGQRMTPEDIARERQIAQALLGQTDTSPVAHWSQGATRMVDALGGVMKERRANAAEGQNAAGSQERIAAMLSSMGGGSSAYPAAPAPAGGGMAAPTAARPTMGDVATNRVAQAHSASALPGSFLSALDMHEGAGDYDTLFGHAQKSGPFAGTSVSSMPIADVLAFASPSGAYGQHVKGKVGRVATPMGRHQIVGTTLRNAVGELGIDPSTPFNAQTQDTIAAHLARRRIQSATTTEGKISALRSEWEGFKNVPNAQMVQIVNDLEAMPAGGAVAANEAMASGQMAAAPVQAPSFPPASVPQDPNIAPEYLTNPNMGGVPPTALAPIEATATEPMAMAGEAPMAAPPLAAPQMIQDQPVAPAQRVAQAMNFPMEEMAGMNPRALPAQPQGGMGGINPAIMEALSSPYASPQERQIAGVMLQQQMSQQQAEQERMRAQQESQIEMQRRQQMATELGIDPRFANDEMVYEQAINQQFRDQPTDIREYEYARGQGYQGSFTDFQLEQKRAGATSVDARNMGSIPQGYRMVYDQAGNPMQMEPIPGGPADTSGSDAASAESRQTSTGIITNAASRAREALNAPGLPATGTAGRLLSNLPESNAAEVRRQVAVLQANAKIENLQAMRAASPTGGALGAVSDAENAMLGAKSGSLDPDSPTFARDLDDYERTLLQVVHGQRVGDAIFEETRAANKPITEMTDEELEALANGD